MKPVSQPICHPQQFAAASLKPEEPHEIIDGNVRHPQQFAAASLKHCERSDAYLEAERHPQQFAAASLKRFPWRNTYALREVIRSNLLRPH